ncbi:MAG TPA: 3-isopropylmalate dehydratase small subunit [Acidobacteriota bacterium]|nr:3-isopropylmalate dehydratase small subunit [Acidobacteriota bacterium]
MKKGRIWKYGDNVNTDVIFPGKYTYTQMEPEEMASHALEDLDPEFASQVQPNDVIVAGRNFGCGSSREQAASCLKYAGVQAVIAKSFARIFFRNAINQGLPVIISEEAADRLEKGEEVSIDLDKNEIITKDQIIAFDPLPDSVKKILDAGGLIPYTKRKIEKGEG